MLWTVEVEEPHATEMCVFIELTAHRVPVKLLSASKELR